jgi:hypothetical protein
MAHHADCFGLLDGAVPCLGLGSTEGVNPILAI